MTMPIALPYGLRDVKLIQYPSLAADTLGSVLVDLPNARTMQFNDTEEYTDLRGDDQLVTSHGQGSQVDWQIEGGGISYTAAAVLGGGTVVETGVSPNRVRRLRKYSTDSRPFFVAVGQAISDSGGDMHTILWRCRSTGNIECQFADTEFLIPQISGTGFPCNVSGTLAGSAIQYAVYDFVQHETITSIVAPALDTPSAPVIYSMSDQTSTTAGGELVVVYGQYFTGVTAVAVTGTAVTDYEIQSPYQLALITPAKAAGSYNVTVTNATGTSATGTQTAIVYS